MAKPRKRNGICENISAMKANGNENGEANESGNTNERKQPMKANGSERKQTKQ